VHGIALANEFNKGYISDGRANSVVVFDLKSLKKLNTVPIKGEGPDAIMYDPYTKRVFSFNGESHNAAVLDAKTDKEIGTVSLDGGPEFAISDEKGHIYNNIEDKNSIAVIDAKDLKVVKTYSLEPGGTPTGLALDKKNHRLFSGCRKDKNMYVLDEYSGKIITKLPIGAGVDAVVYDPSTSLIFCSNGDGTTTIIKQESADQYKVVQTLNTEVRAKTMALDPVTHKIYLSVAKFEPGTRTPVADSFEILVYKMK
ncbi:MAG TPA: YncE family protein, partial [Flavisolibacter sp.]|nr:YncE family protein [Flavisolibacter sp.]